MSPAFLLLLFALPFGQASSTAASQLCTVSGRATNSLTGEPIRKVQLHLTPDTEGSPDADSNDSNRPAYFASSGPDGSFQFTGIEPGSYSLSADHLGFLNATYGAKDRRDTGATLSLQPGQSINQLSLALTPEAVLTGRVVDSDGDPVSQVMVALKSQTWTNGKPEYQDRSQGFTDDRGEFRIFNVEAGKYILSAQRHQQFMPTGQSDARDQITFVQTFYPGTTSPKSASPIHLKAGQEIADIELHLLSMQAFHVRGRVAGASPAELGSHRAFVTLRSEDSSWWVSQRFQPLDKDGTFDIAGVAPGSYRLVLNRSGERRRQNFGSQPVTVTSQDVNDIVVNVSSGAPIHGQVRVSGTPPSGAKPWNPALFHVTLSPSELYDRRGMVNTGAKPDGSFIIENVAPGIYQLDTSDAPDGAYLQSVRLNGEEALGKPLDLRGQSGELQLTFHYGASQLTVKVQMPGAAIQPGGGETRPPAPVLALIPESHPVDNPTHWQRIADRTGSATFEGLAPGTYNVYAFEETPPDELQNPALLKAIEGKGTRLELKEGERKQIQSTAISAGEMREIVTKLSGDAE